MITLIYRWECVAAGQVPEQVSRCWNLGQDVAVGKYKIRKYLVWTFAIFCIL